MRFSRRQFLLVGVFAVAAVLAVTAVTLTGNSCCPPPYPLPTLRTACLQAAEGPVDLVVGAHANRPQSTLSIEGRVIVARAAIAGDELRVIVIDGSPYIVGTTRFLPRGTNELRWRSEFSTFLQDLLAGIERVRAQAPEADPLAALALAARSTEPGGTIIMIDSGLQTVPPLDFRDQDMWKADPHDIAEQLMTTGQLPDLSGRRVVLSGIGDTALPQHPPGIAAYEQLKTIWAAILTRANVTCFEILPEPVSGEPLTDLPPVSVVQVPKPVQVGPGTPK